MNIAEFSAENLARCTAANGFNHPLDLWSASDWLCAVVGEIGEAANIVKKLNRERDGIAGNTATPAQLAAALADELADVFIYLDLTARRHDIDLWKGFPTLRAESIFATLAQVFFARESSKRREIPTASDIVCALTKAAGSMAATISDNARYRIAASRVLTALCALASLFDIDLAQAIRAKFDKTSAKIGYVREVAA